MPRGGLPFVGGRGEIGCGGSSGRKTARVTIPRTNVIDEVFIRYARDRKADVFAQAAGKLDYHA